MYDDGFQMHSPETDEEVARGQGFTPEDVGKEELSTEEMLTIWQLFSDDTNVLFQVKFQQVFTIFYAVSYILGNPALHGMMREEMEDLLAYTQYMMRDAHPEMRPILEKMVEAWQTPPDESEGN